GPGRRRTRAGVRGGRTLGHVDLRIGRRCALRLRGATCGGLRDLRRRPSHARHPVDEVAGTGGVLGDGGLFGLVVRVGAGDPGLGGEVAVRRDDVRAGGGGGLLVLGLLALLAAAAHGGVLDAAEDGLAEEVVVGAGVLEVARGGGGTLRRGRRSASDGRGRRSVLLLRPFSVVDRCDQGRRRLELVLHGRLGRGHRGRGGARRGGRRCGGGRRRDRCGSGFGCRLWGVGRLGSGLPGGRLRRGAGSGGVLRRGLLRLGGGGILRRR